MNFMKARSKRFLSLALAILLAMSLSPVQSLFAEDDDQILGNYTITNTNQTQETAWRPIADIMELLPTDNAYPANPIIVDPSVTYQEYTGIGVSLDHTAVTNLWRLPAAERDKLIRLMADPETGAGMNLYRLCIGSSDLVYYPVRCYSYNDTPLNAETGRYEEDWDLDLFTIEKDIEYNIVQTCLEILKYNPDAIFFGSAWSAPAWMKIQKRFPNIRAEFRGYVAGNDGQWPNENAQDTFLRSECVDVFAKYLYKFVQAYEDQGVPIAGITMLNEPKVAVQYPAMDILWSDQQLLAMAIKREFAQAGFGDKFLWVCDFNEGDWDSQWAKKLSNLFTQDYGDPDSNPSILDGSVIDPAYSGNNISAYLASDGIAFHPYGWRTQWGANAGDDAADAAVRWGRTIQMTESNVFYFGQNGSGTGVGDRSIIKDFNRRNFSSWIGWAPIMNTNGGNHYWRSTVVGRQDDDAFYRAQTGWNNRVVMVPTNNPETFSIPEQTGNTGSRHTLLLIGQIGKYVKPGAVRIGLTHTAVGSNTSVNASNNNSWQAELAFQNPDGEIVVIVRNSNSADQNGSLVVAGHDGYIANLRIPAKAYTTYRFYVSDGAVATPPAKTYDISLNVYDTIDFGIVEPGYAAIPPQTIEYFNAGSEPAGAYTISLTGANASAFALSKNMIYGIDAEGRGLSITSGEFTVAPINGLAVGEYTATVVIGGNPKVAEKSFNVKVIIPNVKATSANGNKQADINFAIRSANGKGYTVFISETGDMRSFKPADANFNSKGAHVKDLTNGKTYYAYINYASGNIKDYSNIVILQPGK